MRCWDWRVALAARAGARATRALALAAALLLAGSAPSAYSAHSAPDERPEISSTEVVPVRDGDASLRTPSAGAEAEEEEGDATDGEVDDAPFVILVEHGDGRRCGGSLLSLRTAVTSATCARARGDRPTRPELWALAAAAVGAGAAVPAADGMRRVTRIALAGASAEGGSPDLQEGTAGGWRGAELDLAVLELEAPFGGGAEARPIIMASSAAECEAPEEGRGRVAEDPCLVVRTGLSRRGVLRKVGVAPVSGARCGTAALHWAAVRDRAFCLVGAPLCESDCGAGVVCGGKLCGVLSLSVDGGDEGGTGTEERCGATHAAQSLARWRRFLHCAHTLRSCGRGECADVCVEHRLDDDRDTEETSEERAASESQAGRVPEPEVETEQPPLPAAETAKPRPRSSSSEDPPPTPTSLRPWTSARVSSVPPTRTSSSGPGDALPPALTSRGALEFEPNRADFKAGEYGDNAVEYAGEEGGGAGGDPARRSPAPASPAPPPRDPASERRVAAPGPARPAAVSGAIRSRFVNHILQIVNCYIIMFL